MRELAGLREESATMTSLKNRQAAGEPDRFLHCWRYHPFRKLRLETSQDFSAHALFNKIPFRRSLYTLAALCTLGAGQLNAQSVSNPDSLKKAGKPLFTHDDALLALSLAGLTVAMFPADKWVAGRLRSPSSGENQFIGRTATGFEIIADPGSIVVGSAAYLIGRFSSHRQLEDVGLHTTEAIVLGSGVTMVLKDVLGRSRPFVTNSTNPRDFKFGKGFGNGDRQSFPSGHTTAAFAAAAAVTSEMHRLYPNYTWISGGVMYGSATMVGLARMYHNEHWASDVLLGAGIGTFSGLKVVRYSHNHPANRIDRWLLRTSIAPNGNGGELVGMSIPWSAGR
jgi:membrane-associated phospholipid phosphatase